MTDQQREILLSVRNLDVCFGKKRKPFKAVNNVSFDIYKGETFGLVGESGSGKTTIGRAIARINPTSAGEVWFKGEKINGRISKQLDRQVTRHIQMIFQDPMASLNERAKVDYIVSEGLYSGERINEDERKARVEQALAEVGLLPEFATRFPHEFSGGQRQRICIARALALNPDFILCDEPVSALDVSIQAQIINLLRDLQKEFGITYLFISHDLSVVEHISDTVGVMYLGSMVEYAPTEKVFANPMHPYTQALISAIPVPDPDAKMDRVILEGSIPSPANPPAGCKFHTRCSKCMEVCKHFAPDFQELEEDHFCACHLYNSPERQAELEAQLAEAK